MDQSINANKISIFSANEERICLFIPLLFFAFAAAQSFYHWKFTEFHNDILFFVAKLFLFHHVHIFFTFAMLMSIPEYKSWAKDRSNFKLEWSLIFVGFWLCFAFLTPYLKSNSNFSFYSQLLALIFLAYSNHHVVSQFFGLSLLYNKALIKHVPMTEQKRKFLLRTELIEYSLLLVSMFCVILYWQRHIITKAIPQLPVHLLPYISLAAVLVNFFISLKSTPWSRSNKSFYLLRTFLIPLSAISIFGVLGFMVAHGFEYFFVFRKSCSSSTLRRIGAIGLKVEICALAIVGLLVCLSNAPISRYLYNAYPNLRSYLDIFFAFGLATSNLHYYLDGQLFRMKNQNSREKIGKLMLPEANNQRGESAFVA